MLSPTSISPISKINSISFIDTTPLLPKVTIVSFAVILLNAPCSIIQVELKSVVLLFIKYGGVPVPLNTSALICESELPPDKLTSVP